MSDVPQPTALPDGLLDRDQWVCWRRQQRDGKLTKVPINPQTSQFASATNADTWDDFTTARETVVDGSADGVGFVFTDDDPFVGVDLDDCRVPETGTVTDEAAAIVETLDSYTEVSPSGTGVHVLVEGDLSDGRNRRDWVECYETARFFTVTGDHVADTPATIEARPSALTAVYEKHVQPESDSNELPSDSGTESTTTNASMADSPTPEVEDDESSAGSGLNDEELIERAHNAANSDKFARLWRGTTNGYESHSEADMALCSLLAFWTGGDAQQIDRLFRESGLLREKWDEQHFADGSTYGEKTIERVLASTDEFYDPDSAETTMDGSSEVSTTSETIAEETPSSTAGVSSVDSSSAVGEETNQLTVAEPTDETAELLSLIDELQAQVERLEAENKQLRAELDTQDTQPVDEPTESSSIAGRLLGLIPW